MSTESRHRQSYPLHKIVAVLERTEPDGVVAALADAGFAGDRIEVVTGEDAPGLDDLVGGSGFHGVLNLAESEHRCQPG